MQVRVANGVEWGSYRANTLHGLLDVIRDFVGTDEQNDVFRPEGDACYPVTYHVHVDELALVPVTNKSARRAWRRQYVFWARL